MPKQTIGKDCTKAKSGIISTPKEHEAFDEWRAEQAERNDEKPKNPKQLKTKMPDNDIEASPEAYDKEIRKEIDEKDVFVNEHYRGRPKKDTDIEDLEDIEAEETKEAEKAPDDSEDFEEIS